MKQTIEIPEGFELKKVSDIEYQIVKKEEKLPNTWKEFCEKYSIKNDERYINNLCNIKSVDIRDRDSDIDKNLLPNKEYAEAILALMQLIQLRDCYRHGWKPNWEDGRIKYVITTSENDLFVKDVLGTQHVFSFQTEEIRDKFFNNFRELLNIAFYLWK